MFSTITVAVDLSVFEATSQNDLDDLALVWLTRSVLDVDYVVVLLDGRLRLFHTSLPVLLREALTRTDMSELLLCSTFVSGYH